MNAIELIKYHEKYRRFPYRCTAGKLTIGYGWNLDDNGITVEQATYILDQQVRAVRVTLSAEPYWINLGVVRQAVITDMAFNLGWPKFALFKRMRAALGEHAYSRAANEMVNSAWYTQVGTRSKRLVGMMRSGEWPADLRPQTIRHLTGAVGE